MYQLHCGRPADWLLDRGKRLIDGDDWAAWVHPKIAAASIVIDNKGPKVNSDEGIINREVSFAIESRVAQMGDDSARIL